MLDLQFYPTPQSLSLRCWQKFKDRNFQRVLEPSAGHGDLVKPFIELDRYSRIHIDACEIDISKHPILREAGINVVGLDFMAMESAASVSHFIMNPPFAVGAAHALHAWDIAFDAEIVAIINAETLRNPCTKDRERLVHLVEQHGSVEFLRDEFMTEETQRKTEVEIALVYLKKTGDLGPGFIEEIMEGMQKDHTHFEAVNESLHEVMLPNSFIENSVAAFNAAVTSMRDSIRHEARARHYARLVGQTMAVRNGDAGKIEKPSDNSWIREQTADRYKELMDRAWTTILRSCDVLSRLSSVAQQSVESEFENIKKLSFTVSNVYSFLAGISESQDDIQKQMIMAVFDEICRYHTDNAVLYKGWRGQAGWKSNDKHNDNTQAKRVRTTRFILPRHGRTYGSDLGWESYRLLADFDKTFAMLSGRREEEIFGLNALFKTHAKALANGERCDSEFFSVRWYPGAQTIHFFPRDKKLIDRLNRYVGKHRKWLPESDDIVSKAFWLMYESAEKLDKAVRAEINQRARYTSSWVHPLCRFDSTDNAERNHAINVIDEAIDAVLEQHGIRTEALFEPDRLALAA